MGPLVAVHAQELASIRLDHVVMIPVHVLDDPGFRLGQRRVTG
jgi:hypothetical protein